MKVVVWYRELRWLPKPLILPFTFLPPNQWEQLMLSSRRSMAGSLSYPRSTLLPMGFEPFLETLHGKVLSPSTLNYCACLKLLAIKIKVLLAARSAWLNVLEIVLIFSTMLLRFFKNTMGMHFWGSHPSEATSLEVPTNRIFWFSNLVYLPLHWWSLLVPFSQALLPASSFSITYMEISNKIIWYLCVF